MGEGGRLIAWDPTTESVESQFKGTREIQAIAISPDDGVPATAGMTTHPCSQTIGEGTGGTHGPTATRSEDRTVGSRRR